MADEDRKLLAFHRRQDENDGVIVVMNFRAEVAENVTFDLSSGGVWRLRLNTDWLGYSGDFGDHAAHDLDAVEDGAATLSLGGYTALVYTR